VYNLLDKGLFLKNRPRLAKKRSIRPSSRLKTVDLDCRSSLSVARLVRFWFRSLQSLTVHDRQFLHYKVTSSFWLCVRTIWVSICAPGSFVHVVYCNLPLRVIALLEHGTPPTVSRNLKVKDLVAKQHPTNTHTQHVYICTICCLSYI